MGTLLSRIVLLVAFVSFAGPRVVAAQQPLPTRWMAPPGVERLQHKVWHSTGPFLVEEISTVQSGGKAEQGRIAIIVEDAVYADIAASLGMFQLDLATKGYSSTISLVGGGTPEDLRDYLIGLYNDPDGLVGTLLVGNVPYIIYELMQDWDGSGGDDPEYEDFPCDLFLMDMNGTWVDDGAGGTVGAGNGKYDGWNDSSHEIEIWAGRLYASTVPQYGSPATVLNTYLVKNHLYRTGQLVPETPPAGALVYVDDDWGNMVEGTYGDRWCAEQVYGDVTAVYDDGNPGNNATAGDYKANQMTADYQLVMLRSHGWPGGHGFYRDYRSSFDYVYNADYRTICPEGLFYSCFVCSGCDYTAEYGWYDSYLGGTIAFNEPYGLFAWGSAKTGGMWNDSEFYSVLGERNTFGAAFVNWFNETHALYPSYAPMWWYGMVMIGDPALVPNGDYFAPVVPQNLVAAVAEAGIGLSWQANTEPDLQHYSIYRSMEGEGPDYLATVPAPATTYEDSAVVYDSTYIYWVTAVDNLENESGFSDPDTCTYFDIAGLAGGSPGPVRRLLRSQPNPFNLSTEISFSVAGERHVALSIYDVSGRCLRTLVEGNLPRGVHTVTWDGRDNRGQTVGMGLYLCRLETDDGSSVTTKVMRLR